MTLPPHEPFDTRIAKYTVPPTLLRLSVGIEAVEDLWTDLDRALRNVPEV